MDFLDDNRPGRNHFVPTSGLNLLDPGVESGSHEDDE